MSRRVVPVSTLVNYLKKVMDENPVLHGVMIEGEISNIRMPYSGHWYFSLKDDHASLKCVMFSSANQKLGFKPENGDKVVLKGDVSVYVVDGSVQMIATNMERSGIGQLYQQFELLKKKLSEEGLFDASYKKPRYPSRIPTTSIPLLSAILVTARIAEFIPGASPPDVKTPIFLTI